MPVRKIILAFCLICFAVSGSRAQQPRPKPASNGSRAPQPVPRPPKPAGDGPSLQVTMKFIQDKLSGIGLMAWAETYRRVAADQEIVKVFDDTEELVNAVADPQGCTIGYHLQGTWTPRGINPRPYDKQIVFDLKQVEKITVESREQELVDNELQTRAFINKAYAKAYGLTWDAALAGAKEGTTNPGGMTVSPAIFAVTLHTKDKSISDNSFHVDDEEPANRLARAITHAVELCTPDKKPEPF